MTVSLRWNRLEIAATSEEEFISAVTDYFPQLLQLPYDDVELDITGSPEITEDAFRSIAIRLVGGEAADKKMRILIPPAVDRYFRHANLYRMVRVDVVRPLARAESASTSKIRKRIESGRYRAPTALLVDSQPAPPAARTTSKRQNVQAAWLVDLESGRRYPIADHLMVGREPPSSVVFQVPTISKRHFVIRRLGNGFAIEDLRSTNGTYLNGLPVNEPVPLRDGDEIVVAITLKHPKGARIFQFTTQPA
jgi:pSer/pThr/pTyr-binding forkhead associated (FHA) protein